jgi:hypothetical protein
MFDGFARKLMDPALTKAGAWAAAQGFHANHVTLVGLALGVLAAGMIGAGAPTAWALAPLLANRIADGLKAPRNGWELSKTAVLSRPPPTEIRLRKAVPRPARLSSQPKVVPVGTEHGLGQVIESPQVAFNASACVSPGGAHADQEGPVTGLRQQQFSARLPSPITQTPTVGIAGFTGGDGRAGH